MRRLRASCRRGSWARGLVEARAALARRRIAAVRVDADAGAASSPFDGSQPSRTSSEQHLPDGHSLPSEPPQMLIATWSSGSPRSRRSPSWSTRTAGTGRAAVARRSGIDSRRRTGPSAPLPQVMHCGGTSDTRQRSRRSRRSPSALHRAAAADAVAGRAPLQKPCTVEVRRGRGRRDAVAQRHHHRRRIRRGR